ncbi:MAG: ubiquinone-dependent pyruvate dehydrogenase [Chitinophagaceae bacterium]
MAKTIAAKLVEILIDAGVKRVHGVVGDSLNGIVDEIRRNPGLEWVHYRHEEAAAFAAGAEAQLTGTLAVCAGSCGPGNLHLINGLYDCHRSMAPVLAIAAHIPSNEIGTGYFQETHPELLFRECSHYCEMIFSAKQVPRIPHIAIQHALGLKGVSVIGISGDIAMEKIEEDTKQHIFLSKPVIRPSENEIGQLADVINQVSKVTLLCGSGCAGAHDKLIALGEKIKSPMVHALRGKEHVEYDNPFDVGMTGLIGFASGYHAMEESDLLIMLGTDFPYSDWFPSKAIIAQVDIRAERLGRRVRIHMGLVGDVRETLIALLPKLTEKTDLSFLEKCTERYKKSRSELDAHAHGKSGVKLIHPEYLTKLVNDTAANDAVFTADVGEPTVWAARYLKMTKDRRLIGSFNHGSMASAMPQAIGAQIAFPKRQVISLSGDGGFAMMMGDLLTILQYDLPVKIVIYNNSSLGFVAMEMKVAGLPPFGTDLKNPDFAKMAEAMGMMGIRVETPDAIKPALEKAFAHRGPVLIDAVVNPSELTMPPKIEVSQAMGFGVYALKQIFNGDGKEVWQTIETNFLGK